MANPPPLPINPNLNVSLIQIRRQMPHPCFPVEKESGALTGGTETEWQQDELNWMKCDNIQKYAGSAP
jgi:hypothetical protein